MAHGPPLPPAAFHFSLCWPLSGNICLDLVEKWLFKIKKNSRRKMTIEKSLAERELSLFHSISCCGNAASVAKCHSSLTTCVQGPILWSRCQTCHCTTAPWMMDVLWWWWMQITILETSGRNWFRFSLFSISGSRKASGVFQYTVWGI